MLVPAWIERLASDLLDLDAELRPLLRRVTTSNHGRTAGALSVATARGSHGYQSVTIAANEARTLLRAAMPIPIGSTRLRQPHARMLAALQLFTAHLLSLNDETTAPDQAAVAGVALAAELRAWLAEARWHQACRAAGVRWKAVSIISLPRQQTAPEREQEVNTLATMAEQHRAGTDPMAVQTNRTARRKAAAAAAAQDALDLAASTTAPPTIAEAPAAAVARMQAKAAAIAAAAAAAAQPAQPPATVQQLRPCTTPKQPIADSRTRRKAG